MADADTLVCVRATAPMTAPGSTFDRSCARCKYRVMIAPTGQALLKKMPRMEIVCAQCFLESSEPTEDIRLAGDPETVLQEVMNAEPNRWRNRN
jgi:hypothetical protein